MFRQNIAGSQNARNLLKIYKNKCTCSILLLKKHNSKIFDLYPLHIQPKRIIAIINLLTDKMTNSRNDSNHSDRSLSLVFKSHITLN